MAADNTQTTDQGTKQGDPGTGDGDNQTVDNKTGANDQQTTDQDKVTDQQADDKTKADDKSGEGDKKTSLIDGDDKDDGKDKTDQEKSQAPEKYDEFTLPQGFTMDDLALKSFDPIARDAGLSQESAQKMINLYAKIQGEQSKNLENLFYDEMEKNIAAVKSDSEIGGNNYDSNIAVANGVVSKFGSKGFVDALKETGLGTNPEVIRLLVRVGKVLGEDVLVTDNISNDKDNTPKTLGDALYPNMKP